MLSLSRQLSRYAALDPLEKLQFKKAVFWLPFLELAIRVKGMKWTATVLKISSGKYIRLSENEIQGYSALVFSAANLSPIRVRCLARTLYMWRESGCDPNIHVCIGMSKKESDLDAHAWLEQNGVILNDQAEKIDFDNAIRLSITGDLARTSLLSMLLGRQSKLDSHSDRSSDTLQILNAQVQDEKVPVKLNENTSPNQKK